MPDVTRTVEVCNKYGLHMRPAHRFMELANQFPCDVTVRMGDRNVSGKSILELTTLGAARGTRLTITCRGGEAQACADALAQFIESLPDADTNAAGP